MGKLYESITPELAEFIQAQRLFFVASAPLAAEGHVNLSPKGHDCLRILGPRTLAYLDLTGSGVETIAHARENGRITLLFCALEGPPKLLRLYGRARVVEVGDPHFAPLITHFPALPGPRAILVVEVLRLADSCGFGVPLFRYEGERRQLLEWAERKGPAGVVEYQRAKNRQSIDQLPGLRQV